METGKGQLTLVLTEEEAEALEKGLRELTYYTGAYELKAWQEIREKLRVAREGMQPSL